MSDQPLSHPGGSLQQQIRLNGINARSGGYARAPFTLQDLLQKVILQEQAPKMPRKTGTYRLAPEFGDGSSLDKSGWGLIFPAGADPRLVSQIEEALAPLTTVRRAQTDYFKIFKGADGYRMQGDQGETFFDFTRRNGAGIGPADPTKIPYYLLLVADPNSIPYSFQFSLDAQYAVGRIYFDQIEDYYHYACSVAAAETRQVRLPRQAVFVGTSHPGDDATALSATQLVRPLSEYANHVTQSQNLDWQVSLLPPEQATKARLDALLGGDPGQTPALLFTATHGLQWPYGDPLQTAFQGALVTQDYPGPADWNGELKRDFYLAGEDISGSRSLLGMVVFNFACFGGGTPYWDEYAGANNQPRTALAHQAFLANLPKKLLSHPQGGALAVIGHVERAWTYSFQWDDGGQQLEALRSVFYQLMVGRPVGKAMENLDERYTTIAGDLLPKVEALRYEPDRYDPFEVAANWIMAKDARGYAIQGDPAVHLPLVNPGAAAPAAPRAGVSLPAKDFPAASLPAVLVLSSLPAAEQAAQPPAPDAPASTSAYPRPAEAPDSPLDHQPPSEPPTQEAPARPPEQAPAQPPAQPAVQGATSSARQTSLLGALVELNQAYGPQTGASFGLKEDTEAALKGVVGALTGAFTSLSESLQKFAADVTSLDVETYVARDLSAPPAGSPPAARPADLGSRVAWTHITLGGDVQVALPVEDGKLNDTLWQAHKDMVGLAQANRTEMIRAVTEALSRLITPVK